MKSNLSSTDPAGSTSRASRKDGYAQSTGWGRPGPVNGAGRTSRPRPFSHLLIVPPMQMHLTTEIAEAMERGKEHRDRGYTLRGLWCDIPTGRATLLASRPEDGLSRSFALPIGSIMAAQGVALPGPIEGTLGFQMVGCVPLRFTDPRYQSGTWLFGSSLNHLATFGADKRAGPGCRLAGYRSRHKHRYMSVPRWHCGGRVALPLTGTTERTRRRPSRARRGREDGPDFPGHPLA